MRYRQQKSAWTPGKNQKRYLAGALDVRTGEMHWGEAQKKDSWLFVAMLHRLTEVYRDAPQIHVILDNYSIHSSKIAQVALSHFARRVRLQFLPPYCPEHNRIERLWQDLHANVTHNHRCRSMADLMKRVRNYLRRRNQAKKRLLTTAADLRTVIYIDAAEGMFVNQWALGRGVHGRANLGESWLDGQPSVILDYSGTSPFIWKHSRDEMWEVAPGLYIGFTHERACPCLRLKTVHSAIGASMLR